MESTLYVAVSAQYQVTIVDLLPSEPMFTSPRVLFVRMLLARRRKFPNPTQANMLQKRPSPTTMECVHR